MIESANHLFKNVFLKNRSIRNAEHLQGLVDEFRQWSGNNRYPTDLLGFTPNEVLQGKHPNKNLYVQQIKEARKQRYLTNKTARFCEVCSLYQKQNLFNEFKLNFGLEIHSVCYLFFIVKSGST